MKKIIYLSIILTLVMTSCNTTPKEENPFFTKWDNEYGLPPFSQIKDSHYLPAIQEGIKQQDAEIKEIIDNTENPTFENTIAKFDKSGELLAKTTGVLFNLSSSNTSDSLKKIVETAIPLLSEHNDNIFMNHDFFAKVDVVYKNQDQENLTTEQKAVLEKIYKNFTINGINLDNRKQLKLRELNKKISLLQQKFSNNMLSETNNFLLILENEEDLSGLPEGTKDAAAEDAAATGNKGKWVITLKNPSYVPFMKYSDRRDLREKLFVAYSSRGNNNNEHDNKQVIIDLMRLRIERAKLLGFASPAHYYMDKTLAKTPEAAYALMNKIMPSALEMAKKEAVELQKIIDREDKKFELKPWDWAYYSEKLRAEKYDLNEDEIRQYFQMENVRQGVFDCASRLYGINFEKLSNAPLYHSEVEAFKITNKGDNSLVGIFYTDYYPRDSKRGGAWMNNFRDQHVLNGKDIRPIIINVGNFTKPTTSKPSLLTTDEVETMFHEFGHAIHGLLSKCNYQTVSGTNTPRDFVEFPSQINENWAFEPEVLATYAKHYKTGETIPDSLVKKIINSSKFNQGFVTTELVAAAILDMDWHTLTSADNISVEEFENRSTKKMGLIAEIIPRYRSTYFNHIFNSGYSAGYYSYLWSEMLEKDAFELFREKGIFDPSTAKSFKENILEKGSSDDLMALYIKFRGAEPSIVPMLKGRGLIE